MDDHDYYGAQQLASAFDKHMDWERYGPGIPFPGRGGPAMEVFMARIEINKLRDKLGEAHRRYATDMAQLRSEVKAANEARRPAAAGTKHKVLNRVVMTAVVYCSDASRLRDAAVEQWPARDRGMVLVEDQIRDDHCVYLRFSYVVHGGHPADVRRGVQKIAAKSEVVLCDEMEIEVLERVKL